MPHKTLAETSLKASISGLTDWPAALLMLNKIEIDKFGRIQTIQTGGQPYSDTYKVS